MRCSLGGIHQVLLRSWQFYYARWEELKPGCLKGLPSPKVGIIYNQRFDIGLYSSTYTTQSSVENISRKFQKEEWYFYQKKKKNYYNPFSLIRFNLLKVLDPLRRDSICKDSKVWWIHVLQATLYKFRRRL